MNNENNEKQKPSDEGFFDGDDWKNTHGLQVKKVNVTLEFQKP